MTIASKLRKIYDYYRFRPDSIIIEPTNKCNLTCTVCFRSLPEREPVPEGLMDIALFEDILAKCKGSVNTVSLYFRGESLLHPQIVRFIELCKANEFLVSLSTNGLLLGPDLMEQLICAGLDKITIDYDEIIGGDYAAIRNTDKAAVVLEKILMLNALKKKLQRRSPEIIIKAVNRGHDPETIAAFIKRLEGAGIAGKAQVSDCFPWPNGRMRPELPHRLRSRPKVCDMFYQEITVTYQGNILACSYDYREDFVIGHISDYRSVADVYREPSYRLFKKRLLLKRYGEQSPCTTCMMPLLGLVEEEFALNTLSGSMYDA